MAKNILDCKINTSKKIDLLNCSSPKIKDETVNKEIRKRVLLLPNLPKECEGEDGFYFPKR